MNKIFGRVKRIITFIMAIAILLNNINYTALAAGISDMNETDDETDVKFEGRVFSDETTEEILEMLDNGLEPEKFFDGDLVKGITKEDLLRWQEEGKDINEIVLERAREQTKTVTYTSMLRSYRKLMAMPDTDGKYYLTECDKPEDKGEVNLSGTIYDGELFNPKTNDRGESTPWFISLGGDEAMCVTYGGSASKISKSHHYVESDINDIKNNPYFKGGSSYPVEAYLKGACYAYETIYHSDNYRYISLDSDMAELVRKTNADMVRYSGRDVNYSVLQIITWRISQGSFNPDNLDYERQLAREIYLQMYPTDMWGDKYYNVITQFYEYYATCATEAASGKNNQKFSTTQVKYWQVNGDNASKWQDFITWNVESNPARENIELDKYGTFTNSRLADATFEIYSDINLTNRIGEFTTDSNGQATITAIEGIYYLKEVKAPKGTSIDTSTIILTVNDDTVSKTIFNDEIYNYVTFVKYDSNTQKSILDSATFALYEWNKGKNTYLKMGYFINDGTGRYILKEGADGTLLDYHSESGEVYKTYKTDKLYYSASNEGRFKIVEEAAPKGYSGGAYKEFSINTDRNGYTTNFDVYSSGISDNPLYFRVELNKTDTLTGQSLTTAQFKLQEMVSGIWYDVGELVYDETTQRYTTSKNKVYSYHGDNGRVSFTKTALDYPVCVTSYNSGHYRLIETRLPNENYTGYYVKEFTAKPAVNNATYSFVSDESGAKNKGKGVKVATSKFDAITNEELPKEECAVITVYEYNNTDNQWYELGDLKQNTYTGKYEMDTSRYYVPHNADGTPTSAKQETDYSKGYIYYTSVNRGRFKLVETLQPLNYLKGTLNLKTFAENAYEKEFYIDETVGNGKVIDLTDISDAPKDTGISVNCTLSKYDLITGQKADTNNAVFEVYEGINDRWYFVGNMVYDEADDGYITKGMSLTLHNSTGREVYSEEKAYGLYYTTANRGSYKIVERTSPDNYIIGSVRYEREFDITSHTNGEIIDFTAYEYAAKNLGIKGTVSVNKFDAATQEPVRTGDTIITVYEKIGEKYYEVGSLRYDESEKKYTSNKVSFCFHDSEGRLVSTDNIMDFEEGYLYYTAANLGQFKVIETKAPTHYTLNSGLTDSFVREFKLTEEGQEFDYTTYGDAVRNFGKSAFVYVRKYDVLTKQEVERKNTEFVVQEYITDLGEWRNVAVLKYSDEKSGYVSNGAWVELHDGNGDVRYKNNEGKLYYTTQNLGKFRIIENSAPTNYTNGTQPYIKEFNIVTEEEIIRSSVMLRASGATTIRLDNYGNSAKNLGNYATVKCSKYDYISREKVKTQDTEFTIYENINSKWIESGRLIYDEISGTYVSNGAEFIFHDEEENTIDTTGVPDFEAGRLYYTTANKGRFKLVETKPPIYYTQEIYEKEFIVTDNAQVISFVDYEEGARNTGVSIPVILKKYDAITKRTVAEGNAKFDIQEYIEDIGEWLNVCTLSYDIDSEEYSTRGIDVMTYHNSQGDVIYSTSGDAITYTSANHGRFRVVERIQPSNYEKGTNVYVKEFDITKDISEGIVNLTDVKNAPNNIGINGIVRVSKYDSITGEKVLSGDARFVVYEYIQALEEWVETGVLSYDDSTEEYVCEGVEFVFHDEKGEIVSTEEIEDFEVGRLYYTTSNGGKFKVKETEPPSNYMVDGFCEEFTISETEEEFEYRRLLKAYDTGIDGRIQLKKEDSIYKTAVPGAVFAVQEWSERSGAWLEIGELHDNEDGTYDTSGMKYDIHTGRGDEVVQESSLIYTTQNRGRFRIVEKQAPKGYMNDMYVSPELTLSNNQVSFELKDDKKATDTPIRVSISKRSATTGEEIAGAKLIVKDMSGKVIDSWISQGEEHIIAPIEPGKYVLIEERAPKGYIVSAKVEFEVRETYELQKVEMFDEEVEGRVVIHKTDRKTGEALCGAVFELRDKNGNLIDTLVTDSDGYAKSGSIAFGIYEENGAYAGSHRYTLCEKAAPEGYLTDTSEIEFEFECGDEQEAVIEKVFDLQNDSEPPVKTGDNVNKKIVLLMIIAAIIIAVLGIESKLKEDKKN